jgi:hypothetical protein
MKETERRRITFTSSLNGISKDQQGNKGGRGREALLPLPKPLYHGPNIKKDTKP